MKRKWSTSCLDWEKRIIKGESLIPIEPLFPEYAEACERIFKELIVADVIGQPKMGEITREWALEFVRVIFGAYDPEERVRLITEFYLLISKKNTKSTLAAGIMLTAMIVNERFSAEGVIIAPTKEIANNSFNPARDMIKNDYELSELFNVSEHTRTITHRVTGAVLKVLAADTDTVGGGKYSFVLIDEVHIFGKRSGASTMFREVRGGLTSRPEGFTIYLTTQSSEQPVGVHASILNYARDIRDGKVVNKQFLPLIYEFPQKYLEKKEHLKPENFYITNPNLGASVSERYLNTEFEKAANDGEEELNDFLAKHLNVEIGMNLRDKRWMGADFWERQTDKTLTLKSLIERSEVVTIGGDGGGLDDMLGLAVIGREKGTRKWIVWTRAWVHQKVLELRKQLEPSLRDFERQGDLVIVEQSGKDCMEFGEICKQVYDAGLLDRIGLDPLMVGSLIDGITEAGVPEEMIVGIGQGYKLSGYMKTAERKLDEGTMWHADQRMMDWCVGNARVETRGNNNIMTKQASGKSKIDPVIALLNASSLMELNPAAKGRIGDFMNNVVMVGV